MGKKCSCQLLYKMYEMYKMFEEEEILTISWVGAKMMLSHTDTHNVDDHRSVVNTQ